MRVMRSAFLLGAVALAAMAAPMARAEYFVLSNGQRLAVTGYELIGDEYRLQMPGGGFVKVAVADVVSIEPEDTFKPIPPTPDAKPPFRELVEAAAARYSVDADLISSVIAAESNFDPKAVSRKNARGLMQLLPETAERLGVKNIEDPQENIDGGTRYLRELLQRYNNDLVLTLAAYNAGPERVQRFGGNVPPFPETISYVRRVKRHYEKSKTDPKQPSASIKAVVADLAAATENATPAKTAAQEKTASPNRSANPSPSPNSSQNQ
jgi:soluble lytic murein transglycosylase-like protein